MNKDQEYIPPFPKPLKKRPNLIKRFLIGRKSWIHVFFEKSYSMKMGHVRLPWHEMFVVNQPSLVKDVLINHADNYPKSLLLHKQLTDLMGNGIFISAGDDWLKQRKMMEKALDQSHIRLVYPLMQQAVDVMLENIESKRQNSNIITVNILMAHVTADIIFRTILSETLEGENSLAIYQHFSKYQDSAAAMRPYLHLGISPKLLGFKAKKHAKKIRNFLGQVIRPKFDEYWRQPEQIHEASNILDALLMARDDNDQGFAFEELIDQISVLFLAGHETSATALTWALYLLANCPHYQDQVAQESLQIVNDNENGKIEYVDIKKLKMTANVFKETLRLYPPVGGLLRDVKKQTCMRDKVMKPGAAVMVLLWLLHRNTDIWHNAHAFEPERFDREDCKAAQRNAYYPYSAGERVCAGASFANQEAILILATLISRYRVSLADNKIPEPIGQVTIKPNIDINLVFEPR